ncbi:MAG: ABC-type transport auxiliary lipoprotein family protein [Lysobacter sp.]
MFVAGCSILGGGVRERSTIYDLDPRVATSPSWPSVDWQLSLPRASASRITDSLRIAVRPTPNELQVYKGASWSRVPTDMIEDAILRTLEDSGKVAAVARQGSGISAEYKLVLDLRRFESAYTTPGMPPTVRIELNAKLLRSADQQVVASRTFLQENPVASVAIDDVVEAFEQGLQTVTGELVGWVLTTGSRDGHPGQG